LTRAKAKAASSQAEPEPSPKAKGKAKAKPRKPKPVTHSVKQSASISEQSQPDLDEEPAAYHIVRPDPQQRQEEGEVALHRWPHRHGDRACGTLVFLLLDSLSLL